MRHLKILVGIIGFVIFFTQCKTSQVSQSSAAVDTTYLAIDSLPIEPKKDWLITQKGDTLDSLFQEVDIAIERLLPDTVSIVAVGDIMIGTKFPNASYLPPQNGERLFEEVKESLQKADITFGNLEGTILDGEGDPKKCKNPKSCYLFKMPSKLAGNLVASGFDLLSLANNHANDFGETGRQATQSILDSLGIAYAGSIEQPFTLTKIGHLKVGFIAFAPNKGTLTFFDTALATRNIAHLDSLADMVIVSIHGGAEGANNMHVTRENEYYYGENRGNIYAFSHLLIDAGADVILGHGPHVVRGIEVYKKRLIAYSLGNFLTYGRFNLKGPNGEAPLLQIKTTANGQFIEGAIESYYQSYTYGPQKDERQRALNSIRTLTKEDFPENEIIIEEDGRIIYIQN